jgi:hypothetical protein
MGAMLSGARCSVDAIVSAWNLRIAFRARGCVFRTMGIAAHAVTSLIMPRSILTEKLSRRGYHLTREYGVDPLEMVSVMEVMSELCETPAAGSEQAQAARSHEIESPDVFAFADETCRGVAETMATTG